MNKIFTVTTKFFSLFAIATAICGTSRAQTATWTGGGGDTDWNNAANWDIGTPAEGTNAVLPAGVIVDYIAPMAATGFAGVNNSGTLSVSAAGFNIDAAGLAAYTGNGSSVLKVGSGGVMVATNSGTITLTTDSTIDLEGGVLAITNSSGTIAFGANGNNNGAGFTNNGGAVTFSQPFISKGRFSRFVMNGGTVSFSASGTNGIFETSNDQERQFLINGGAISLGNFAIGRTLNTLAGAGLVISNGTVNATTLIVGNGIAAGSATIAGGVLTNTGTFTIADRPNAATSGQRRIFFYVRGGSVYSTDPAGIVVANQANNSLTGGSTVWGGFLDIASGLVVAEKLTLVGPNAVTNAFATLTLSGSGALYLGSGGLKANVGFSNTAYTVALSGGTLGAKADYSINANAALSGTFTVNAADLAGAPHNLTNLANWSGSGTLVKAGPGAFFLASNNSFSGNTIVSGGILALGANGSISNTPQIILTNGGIFDVSAKGGINLAGSQALSGQGSIVGNLTANSGNGIRPGGNSIAGTLTFSNALIETGGVLNNFDLSPDPNSGNDFIDVAGDLELSGANTIQINTLVGPLPAASTYTLIHYAGNLTGGIANLSLSGASGSLTLDTGAKTISLTVSGGIRAATNATWIGSAADNNWDMLVSSNWLNGSARDYFVAGDLARFDDNGAANPVVAIVGSVLPGSVVVDSGSNYTFTGAGTLDGNGGLTKTNSGTLTLLTTNNNYPGATIIGAGGIEAAGLANGGSPSSLGAAGSAPANLQFFDATLRYTGGNASSDRGATLNGNAIVDVAANALTMSGGLIGAGNLTKSGAGTLILSSASSSYSGTTTVSNGLLQINNAQAAISTNAINLAGGTLFLNIGGQPTYANAIHAIGAGGLNVAANNTIFNGPWSGAATVNINIASGGFFTFNTDITTNFTGIFALGNSAGLFRFNAGGGNPALGSDFATFDLGTNTAALVNRNGAGLTYLLGGLAGGPTTQLRGSENTGSASTYQIGANNINTTFAGSIRTGAGGDGATVTVLKVGYGALKLSGTNTYTGSTIISNGVLALSGVGTIDNSTTISVLTNTVLDTSGRVDGALSLNSGQTLRGSGILRGSLTVRSGATLTVGDTDDLPDSLTITNALVLQSGSVLNMDLDDSASQDGRTNDLIQGLAGLTYGGTLTLTVLSIETNSVFKLFSAGNYGGAFESISPALPPLFPSVWGWDTSKLTVDGTLRLSPLRPSISGISISGADLTLNGINGLPSADFYLLASTNAALPLGQWTAIGTNNFGGGGNFTFVFSGVIEPAAPRQFYILQMP